MQIKERLSMPSLSPVNVENRLEVGPVVEILGSLKEFSQSKRWFRDTTPRPDVG